MTNAVPGVRAADVWGLARTLYREARGSTQADRIAVAWVVRNRPRRTEGYRSRVPCVSPGKAKGRYLKVRPLATA
jgi:hypothetical protein